MESEARFTDCSCSSVVLWTCGEAEFHSRVLCWGKATHLVVAQRQTEQEKAAVPVFPQ